MLFRSRHELKPLSVHVDNPEACPRYAAVVIDGVSPEPSPWWLKRDLEAVGIGSVNSIVDVTNYVMMSLGHPLHAFDYDRITGHRLAIVQTTQKVSFAALNGKTYSVPAGAIIIKDGSHNAALAGIIGGTSSHITEHTRTVVLEAAVFHAATTRRTSQALGLRTEASSRFEKGLNQEMIPYALAMAVDLIKKIYPNAQVASGVVDKSYGGFVPTIITLEHSFLEQRLGTSVSVDQIKKILERLQFGVRLKKRIFTITVPAFRTKDIAVPIDIVEEVARIYGYNKIEPVMPRVALGNPERSITSRLEREIKSERRSHHVLTRILWDS